MTRMDYTRNHARSLSKVRQIFGDDPVYVTCMICLSRQPADGINAHRARVERGVKSHLGYSGPSQVWLCSACACEFGTVVTRELAEQLWPKVGTVLEETEQPGETVITESWSWVVVAGVAAAAAGVTYWVLGGDE